MTTMMWSIPDCVGGGSVRSRRRIGPLPGPASAAAANPTTSAVAASSATAARWAVERITISILRTIGGTYHRESRTDEEIVKRWRDPALNTRRDRGSARGIIGRGAVHGPTPARTSTLHGAWVTPSERARILREVLRALQSSAS